MADLRNRIIRLAHANPDLRPHLLPLLGKSAGSPPGPGNGTNPSSYAEFLVKQAVKNRKDLIANEVWEQAYEQFDSDEDAADLTLELAKRAARGYRLMVR